MLPAIFYLGTSSSLSILSSLFRLNWVYDVIIYLLRLTQMLATAEHHINMFSKIATFMQNQFITNLICGLRFQPIFKHFSTN